MLRNLDGVSVRRVVDRSGARVLEHAHDRPVLSLFVLGAYTNWTEIGETIVQGPSAVFYRAGAAHCNLAGAEGFEQIEIEFDPAWLGLQAIPDRPVQHWVGGKAGAEARSLAHLCNGDLSAERLLTATRRYFENRVRYPDRPKSEQMGFIDRSVRGNPQLKISDIAKSAGLHPSWLGHAYKCAVGEGLLETMARLRVERATRLLRETDQPYASVAAEAGFCDQSHMNRTFQRILGRRPSTVRQERAILRQT